MKLIATILLSALCLGAQTKTSATQIKTTTSTASGSRVLLFSPNGAATIATLDSTFTLSNGVLSCTAQTPPPVLPKTATGVPAIDGTWTLPSVPTAIVLFSRNGIVLSPTVDYTLSGAVLTITAGQGFDVTDNLIAVYY